MSRDLPPEESRPGYCARLIKSMYGTRQAAANWEAFYGEVLKDAGFLQVTSNPCLFLQTKMFTLLDLCVSSLRRGHANILCIVPSLTDDPRKGIHALRCLVFPPIPEHRYMPHKHYYHHHICHYYSYYHDCHS